MNDDLTEKQYLTRESFAQFGRALYSAQCVERQLAILGAMVNAEGRTITGAQFEQELDSIFSLTLGRLKASLVDSGVIPPDDPLSADLDRCLVARNRLAHDYWWENAVAISNDSGKRRIIDECSSLADFFDEVDQRLTELADVKRRQLGVPDGMAEAAFHKLVSLNPAPVAPKPRLLQRTERVTGIYRVSSPEKSSASVLLFEFSDGSLWTLGDRGLTYPTQSVLGAPRTPHRMASVLCPFEFCPRAEVADPWNYRITLSKDYHLSVQNSGSVTHYSIEKRAE